jgi:hypothetical protein
VASLMQGPEGHSDSPMSMGMEHPANTLGVPPLIDDRALSRFCTAVERYAGGAGRRREADAAIAALRGRLDNLRRVAQLCRLAVLGHPRSVALLRDELRCIAIDYPADDLTVLHDDVCEDEPGDIPVRMAAAIDLFAGASFVSEGDPEQREQLVVGLLRAIEAAICFPLAFAREAARYLGGENDALSNVHAAAVISAATNRLIENEVRCNPPVPLAVAGRLRLLAHRWLHANPVNEMFRALTGPGLDGVVVALAPDDVRVGDRVTLQLRAECGDCADEASAGQPRRGLLEGTEFVLFCPAQPATIVGASRGFIEVIVPDGARTGPVVLVREPDLTDLRVLVERYACEYPDDWADSLFGLIPMWKWAYPAAFGAPVVEVTQVPTRAKVKAFTRAGALAAGQTVGIGDDVYIHYVVDPPGSEAEAPLQASASLGVLTFPQPRGLVVYTPAQSGDDAVVLTWGALTTSVVVRVAP